MEEEYKKWLVQFRKGYIELCVLTLLKNKGDKKHGLGLIRLFEDAGLFINEGTLYPLLNRMEQNTLLSSSWNIPKTTGHPKKEYTISQKGAKMLTKMMEIYNTHHQNLINLQEMTK